MADSESLPPSALGKAGVPVDNPYWGGPEPHRHSLEYLLHQIESGFFCSQLSTVNIEIDTSREPSDHELHVSFIRSKSITSHSRLVQDLILFHNDSYLVLNKPADLRMDGPYPASVLKLITFLFPPDSLIRTFAHPPTNGQLLQEISKIHTFPQMKDTPFRTTHQLDFATSGVLFLAKTKKAAAWACQAFQNRLTRKEYLAIVHGHVTFFHTIPILPMESLQQWHDGTKERTFRKRREREGGGCGHSEKSWKKGTFQGYMPVHSVFLKWKSMKNKGCSEKPLWNPHNTKTTSTNNPTESDTNRGRHNHSLKQSKESEWFSKLQPEIALSEVQERKAMGMSWTELKYSSDVNLMFYFEQLTQLCNSSLRKKYSEAENIQSKFEDEQTITDLPPFFRILGEEPNSFYINVSLAEIPNQFQVVIDQSSINSTKEKYKIDHLRLHPHTLGTCDLSLLFRPSLTRCSILWQGEWNGDPITKVRLQPKTGRRHQLRAHMACCGHPIFGDATYEVSNQGIGLTTPRLTSTRMCLHAHKLSIPMENAKIHQFIAPDPFLFMDSSREVTNSVEQI